MGWYLRNSPRLRVAVTGHRLNQLPSERRDAVRTAIGAALAAIGEAAAQAGHGYTKLTLLSALAEGADRYAAQAALALGWRLEAALPFKIERYLADFADAASRAEFKALLAAARRVFEIDGEALEPGGAGEAAPYAAVGDALVLGADVLIAVWNGQPPKGPGGTAEVCAKALDKGAPVVWLPPDAAGPARLVIPTQRPPRSRSFRERLRAALAERFPRTPRPAEMALAKA